MKSWTQYEEAKLLRMLGDATYNEIEKAFSADCNCEERTAEAIRKHYKDYLVNRSEDDIRLLTETSAQDLMQYEMYKEAVSIFDVYLQDQQEVVVLNLSDVHGEAYGSYLDLFEKKIEQATHNRWRMNIAGDLFDNSEKFKDRSKNVKKMRKNDLLRRYKNVLRRPAEIGLIDSINPGNHDSWVENVYDIDLVEELADDLRINYFPTQAIVNYNVGNFSYSMFIMHGFGGGRKSGSAVNKVIDLCDQMEGIDIVVIGHHHKPQEIPTTKVVYSEGRVFVKEMKGFILPSFAQGMKYALLNGLRPASMTEHRIHLYGNRREVRPESRSMWDLGE